MEHHLWLAAHPFWGGVYDGFAFCCFVGICVLIYMIIKASRGKQ